MPPPPSRSSPTLQRSGGPPTLLTVRKADYPTCPVLALAPGDLILALRPGPDLGAHGATLFGRGAPVATEPPSAPAAPSAPAPIQDPTAPPAMPSSPNAATRHGKRKATSDVAMLDLAMHAVVIDMASVGMYAVQGLLVLALAVVVALMCSNGWMRGTPFGYRMKKKRKDRAGRI